MATFFENQDQARRSTRVLLVLFVLAFAAVVLAVDLVLATGWLFAAGPSFPPGRAPGLLAQYAFVPVSLWGWGALLSSAVILGASGWQILQLSAGGRAVARLAGARPVAPATTDPLERRLMNVVEEMAIASGVRVPGVYVMDGESGINAFAAGFDVSDSVVAVTRGALERLSRDELQGVVAHEFSHILNGDMRLNIRMIGLLAGILFVGAVGEFLMRSARHVDDTRGAVPAFAGGLLLFIVGYVGLFFARLIKAAVSRQREFLADASSVQFTRNPDGIAGALDQISLAPGGAAIRHLHAEDLSHMFFGQGIRVWWHGLFDTHPPVEERIRRAHPRFDRNAYRARRRPDVAPSEAGSADPAPPAGMQGFAPAALAGRRGADLGTTWGRSAADSAAMVGALEATQVDYASRLLASLPDALRRQLQQPAGARAAMVALLLAPKQEVMEGQLRALKAKLPAQAGTEGAIREAWAHTRALGPAFHLPVLDLALPAAKASSEAERDALLAALEAVIHADRRVSLHEFVVLTLARTQLGPREKPAADGRRRIADREAEALVVLSLVVHAGTRRDATGARGEAVQSALRAGAAVMGLQEPPAEGSAAGLTLEIAVAALEGLRDLAPMQKAVVVKGLFAAVTHDGTIRLMEAELMRLVGAVLDCPLPPLLDAVDPATLPA